MTERNGQGPRVALYARASTSVQEHSIPGQLRELRLFAAREGFEVVEEIEDLGEKRHTLDRPGIDRVRDLAETGAVAEIWAWEWSRFGAFPVPEVLAVELRDHGVELRALDDGGGGEDGEDMAVIKSLFSRREQRDRVRRANRGRRDKALRGAVFGGFRARYGLRFVKGRNKNGQEVNVGYEVDPETIAVVRRIFEMVANGESLHTVQREFEQGGIPNPSGGPQWSRTTIKGVVADDVYAPHTRDELEGVVSANVLAGLDSEKPYGIHWSGRKRSRFKNSRSKQRVVYETPPEEWTAIPVDLSGSGLERGTVDRARAAIKDNRVPSKVDGRFWNLSGGVLFCAECGRAMHTYRRAKKSGYNHYYRCRSDSSLADCSNRKSHPAEGLEYEAAATFERYASRGTLLELFDQAVAEREQRSGLRGSLERRTALVERSEALGRMRRGFQDQQAEGLMSMPELRERLAELDEEREQIAAELRATEDATAEARRIEETRAALGAAGYDPVHAEWYEDPDAVQPGEYLSLAARPEEIRTAYRRYGVRFEVSENGRLTMWLSLDLDQPPLQYERTS